MKYIEYGKDNKEVIMLLHGGGMSCWNYREVAEILGRNYHVILPILNGHAGSDINFTTIKNNAAIIIDFINKHFDGSILLLGGLSLGGQIVLEMLSQSHSIAQYTLIESASVIPSKLTHSLIAPVLGFCYEWIKNKHFSKLQFKALKIKPSLFDDYYRDTCGIEKKDMIAFLQENSMYSLDENVKDSQSKVHIFVGEKENLAMQQSANTIHRKINYSVLTVLPGMYHGQFSMNHAQTYANKVLEIVNN